MRRGGRGGDSGRAFVLSKRELCTGFCLWTVGGTCEDSMMARLLRMVYTL